MSESVDFHSFVMAASRRGRMVVQPRMGVPDLADMGARLLALAALPFPTIGTLTVDSYTRVGDLAAARRALLSGEPLNGFPLVTHPPEMVRAMLAPIVDKIPVQVRHGSADPTAILRAARTCGITASEGGPVSYCLPYSRLSLGEATRKWAAALQEFSQSGTGTGPRPHLETFGGCMLGQLCPPSLLVALSILESLFIEQNGLRSISLSYAEQGHSGQDIAAIRALNILADEHLSPSTDWHTVHYTFMGVFPRTRRGAVALMAHSARTSRLGRAHRLLVKSAVEAHRLPTLSENLGALALAAQGGPWQWDEQNDHTEEQIEYETAEVLLEARALVDAVRSLNENVGTALCEAFRRGLLDVPYCLHPDNAGVAKSILDSSGRSVWANPGAVPVPRPGRAITVSAGELLSMLNRTAAEYDRDSGPCRITFVGGGPRALSVLERLATLARGGHHEDLRHMAISVVEPYMPGSGRIWRTNQQHVLKMNTVCQEVTMFSDLAVAAEDFAGAGRSLDQWWRDTHPETYQGPNGYAPRALYGAYLQHVWDVVVAELRDVCQVEVVKGEVADIQTAVGEYEVVLGNGRRIQTDAVVLATGHPRTAAFDNVALQTVDWSNAPLQGDSAADLPIDEIAADDEVGVCGLGLCFYDIVALLTTGRGGVFETDDERAVYLPSGKEPHIIGMSRSGLPLPARGVNQKSSNYRYQPLFFRRESLQPTAGFRDGVLRALLAEVHVVYYGAMLRHLDPDLEGLLRAWASAHSRAAADNVRAAAEHLSGKALPDVFDLHRLARPFDGRRFANVTTWTDELLQVLRRDCAEASLGNVEGPLKAGLDVIRDVRGTLRVVLESGQLSPAERRDFDCDVAPVLSLLTAGPSIDRIVELKALIESGVVTIAPPGATIERQDGGLMAIATTIEDFAHRVDHVIDARIPKYVSVAKDGALLTRLMESGTVRAWSQEDDTCVYQPGGIAIDHHARVVMSDGRPRAAFYALGIPTEGVRWFTQVGSGRPGRWTDYNADADRIARALIQDAQLAGVTPAPEPRRSAVASAQI